ncbi:hypothetical protein KEM56_001540 [Ascosphaera pollenicola]|nr:hypothetical protein KEM56_001540 [Ascosphaera pollenicola]
MPQVILPSEPVNVEEDVVLKEEMTLKQPALVPMWPSAVPGSIPDLDWPKIRRGRAEEKVRRTAGMK